MTIKPLNSILAALLPILSVSAVQAAESAERAPAPAERIVGTWEALTRTGPCDGPFGPPFLAFTVFHAGGTLSETNMAPLGGVTTPFGQAIRGPAFGTWSYEPRSRSHSAQMRFNWFVDGFYHGYQQIHFERIDVATDGNTMTATFTAERHFIDGRPPVPNCGDVVMVRTP